MQDMVNKPMGVRKLASAYGIIGFVRFMSHYYIYLVTKQKLIGTIGPHKVYSIVETMNIPVVHPLFQEPAPGDEDRYRSLFFRFDLTQDFYYSKTYPLTYTLQFNMLGQLHNRRQQGQGSERKPSYNDMFAWNHYMLTPMIENDVSESWTIPLIHGSFVQNTLDVVGRSLQLTVIARRSRLFAGARFQKRGVDEQGHVANDVEMEQILTDPNMGRYTPRSMSSYVQHRGSIPLYWAQVSAGGVIPKPPISIQRVDPYYNSAILHFMDLMKRYGAPLIVLNLIKSRESVPREMILREAYSRCLEFINSSIHDESKRIVYIAWDFKKAAKNNKSKLQRDMYSIAQLALLRTGFFHADKKPYVNELHAQTDVQSQPSSQQSASNANNPIVAAFSDDNTANSPRPGLASSNQNGTTRNSTYDTEDVPKREPSAEADSHIAPEYGDPRLKSEKFPDDDMIGRLQYGAVRTNCIDSIDRTNAAQYLLGLCALSQQLYAMGIIQSPDDLTFDSPVSLVLMEMYEIAGHQLALQYGGSGLAHTMNTFVTKSIVDHSKDFWTVVQRYYRNTFTDQEKQHTINLFLGVFRPWEHKHGPDLWALESDYHLHIFDHERELLYTRPWWVEPLQQHVGIFRRKALPTLSLPHHSVHGNNNGYSSYNGESGEDDSDADGSVQPLAPTAFDDSYQTHKLSSFDKILSYEFRKPRRAPIAILNPVSSSKKEQPEKADSGVGIMRWLWRPKSSLTLPTLATSSSQLQLREKAYASNPLAWCGMTLVENPNDATRYTSYCEAVLDFKRLMKKRKRYNYYRKHTLLTHHRRPKIGTNEYECPNQPFYEGLIARWDKNLTATMPRDIELYASYASMKP